jgi:cell division protein FtsQ
MSATIKRGPPPRRVVKKRPVKKPSLGDRLLAHMPVGEETLKKAATWSILGVLGAGAIAAAVVLGVPGMAGQALAEEAGAAGLRVEQIEITGLKRMDRMSVYAVALDQQSRAMPLVDLAGVREKLLKYGWIADARVSRRLPDTLLVDIVEREPAAVWQDQGQLTLIDKDGVLLEPVDPGKMPDLPFVIGPGADKQEPAYQKLMAAAPALRGKVKAAAWVGNRRWDLTFQSGETLALPQDGAAAALMKFAEMDRTSPLLGKGWLRFDLRDPTKLVARKPDGGDLHAIPDVGGTSTTPAKIETASTDTV